MSQAKLTPNPSNGQPHSNETLIRVLCLITGGLDVGLLGLGLLLWPGWLLILVLLLGVILGSIAACDFDAMFAKLLGDRGDSADQSLELVDGEHDSLCICQPTIVAPPAV